MRTLNDPVECDGARITRAWTPARGLVRAAWQGLIVAAALAGLLVPLALYLPYMIIPVWLRTPMTFAIAWLLLARVQRAAGMVGPHCSAIALVLTAIVLASNHVMFALNGVPDPFGADEWWVAPMGIIAEIVPNQKSVLIGWKWCDPGAILTLNLVPLLLGGGFCAAFRSRG